jgi:hypothetical protein
MIRWKGTCVVVSDVRVFAQRQAFVTQYEEEGGGGEESAGRIRSAPERANETRKCTKEVALLYQMSKEGAVSDMPSLEKQGGTERA